MANVTPFDVVIVGAGPAGIAAACRLLSKGINRIVLLEAENRIGGRVHSIPFGMDNNKEIRCLMSSLLNFSDCRYII